MKVRRAQHVSVSERIARSGGSPYAAQLRIAHHVVFRLRGAVGSNEFSDLTRALGDRADEDPVDLPGRDP